MSVVAIAKSPLISRMWLRAFLSHATYTVIAYGLTYHLNLKHPFMNNFKMMSKRSIEFEPCLLLSIEYFLAFVVFLLNNK